MYIPSNFSLEETLKVIPSFQGKEILQEKIEEEFVGLLDLEEQLDKSYRDYEHREEQDSFKYDLLETIQELCTRTGSKKELVKAIQLAFEESQVEM